MEQASVLTSMEIADLVLSNLTPFLIFCFGILFNNRLKKMENRREDERLAQDKLSDTIETEKQEARHRLDAKEEKEREDRVTKALKEQEERQRVCYPHIEFNIECHILGPYQGKYAAEFILSADNKGLTRHEFKSIKIDLRGIFQKDALSFWEKKSKEHLEHLLKFPEPIHEDELVPKNVIYFVEPGVNQRFSYITLIDEKIGILKAYAEFRYNEKGLTFHSTARMFEVTSNSR